MQLTLPLVAFSFTDSFSAHLFKHSNTGIAPPLKLNLLSIRIKINPGFKKGLKTYGLFQAI